MTEHPEQPRVGRSFWSRPWPWIALGAVVVVVVVVLIGIIVSISSNASSPSPRALLTRVIERTDDTAVTAGGVWTFDDKSPWVPSDTSGYTGVPCGTLDAGPQQYPVQINSGGVASPKAAAARVVKRWKILGYRVQTVVPTQADDSQLTELAADLGNGAQIVYGVSTKISTIDSLSECSSDPAMRVTTK